MLSKVKVFDAMGRYLRVLTDEGMQAKLDFESDLQRMGELLNKIDSITKNNSSESNSIIDTIRNLLNRTCRFDSIDHFIFFLEKLQPVIQALPSSFIIDELMTYIRQSKLKWEECKANMSNAELLRLRYAIVENLQNQVVDGVSHTEIKRVSGHVSKVLKAVSSLILPERRLAHQQLIEKLESLNRASEMVQSERNFSDPLNQIEAYGGFDESNKLHDEKNANEIHIHNAGLALIAPLIQSFFEKSGYVNNGKFANDGSQIKSIALLQFLVEPAKEFKRYNLALNKLLCGLSFTAQVEITELLSDVERCAAEDILTEITKNVDIFNNISLDGFRSAFINRSGTLVEYGNHLLLRVRREKFDVILDKVPWQYQVIRFPWMKLPLVVEW